VATEDDLRRVARSLPETEERASYGKRPSWKVAGKGFVGIWKDETSASLIVESIAERDALLQSSPEKFFTTPHYGDSPRLLVRLEMITVQELRELVTDAWRSQAPAELVQAFDQRDST
jgi:hypothetical protein